MLRLVTSTNTPPRIFGKEPAVWVGFLEAVLTVLLAFQLGITQTSYGPWVAVIVAVGGLMTAWLTRDTMLGVIVGLLKAVVVLVAVYGFTLTDDQTAALIALVSVVVGFFQRTQTSPTPAAVVDAADPSDWYGPNGQPTVPASLTADVEPSA